MITNNILTTNNENNDENEIVEFSIEITYIEPTNNEYNEYFKSCKEINENLCKPVKIKKDDIIIGDYCHICMDEYKYGEFKRTLPKCLHHYHKKCIDKWLKKKASCPICRDNLKNVI